MKWYWVITSSNGVANPLVTDIDNFGQLEDELVMGQSSLELREPLWLAASRVQNDGDPDDALQNHLALPVLSRAVQNAMVASRVRGAAFVPVDVIRPNRTKIDGYAVLNVLHRRDGLNLAKSEFERFPDDYVLPQRRGMVRSVRRPVLVPQSTVDTDFLRLNEYPSELYVSEVVRQIFEDRRFTGWSFREIEVA